MKPEEEPDIPEAEEDLSVDTRPPKKEEIIMAINLLRNHKAPSKDRLNAKLFKADAVTTAEIFQPLFSTIWDTRKIPDDWNQGIVIIKIPKMLPLFFVRIIFLPLLFPLALV